MIVKYLKRGNFNACQKRKKLYEYKNDCFFKLIYVKQRFVLYIFQQLQRSRKREFNADHIIYDKKN